MPEKRYRLRFFFWLNVNNPDEEALADTIEILKNDRTFTNTIRDGIRLMCDLRAGHMDILLELFPWVKEALQPINSHSTEQRLQEQITRLEKLLLAQGNVPIQPPLVATKVSQGADNHSQTGRSNTKPLVEISDSGGKASAEVVAANFLSSMKGLASGFFD